jgi:tetratricopeptide (TPR) repeat protein
MVRDQDRERAERETASGAGKHPTSARSHGVMAQLLLLRNDLNGAQQSDCASAGAARIRATSASNPAAIPCSVVGNDEARARIDAFLVRHPHDASALVLAAKVYKELAQPVKVEELLTRALAADPANPSTYALLAEVYISQKRLADAKKQFTEIVKLKPRSVAALTMMGLICYADRDLDGAQQWWEKAMQVDSYAAAAANNLAWLYAEGRGARGGAAAGDDREVEVSELPEVNDTLGWVYYRSSDSQAILYPAAEPRSRANNPAYHFHLGMAYARKGDDAKARKLLERVLKIDPQFPDAPQVRERSHRWFTEGASDTHDIDAKELDRRRAHRAGIRHALLAGPPGSCPTGIDDNYRTVSYRAARVILRLGASREAPKIPSPRPRSASSSCLEVSPLIAGILDRNCS